jgi:hypothetical protein
MKLRELLSTETIKARKASWTGTEFVELPGLDPDGFRDTKARYVCEREGIYFQISEIDDGQDDWLLIEPEKDDWEIDSLIVDRSNHYRLFLLPFGPDEYKGKTLDQIACTNAGLLFLDQLLDKDWVWPQTKETIRSYLSSPSIQRELDSLI